MNRLELSNLEVLEMLNLAKEREEKFKQNAASFINDIENTLKESNAENKKENCMKVVSRYRVSFELEE